MPMYKEIMPAIPSLDPPFASLDLSHIYLNQIPRLITPSDPLVLATASNKAWNVILDYVAYLPVGTNTNYQFPNQTISRGEATYYLDVATLCCSMFRARGYQTYIVKGISDTTPYWIVFQVNGIKLSPSTPNYPWNKQNTLNFTNYKGQNYIDKYGVYPTVLSFNPPLNLPQITPLPTPTPTPSL